MGLPPISLSTMCRILPAELLQMEVGEGILEVRIVVKCPPARLSYLLEPTAVLSEPSRDHDLGEVEERQAQRLSVGGGLLRKYGGHNVAVVIVPRDPATHSRRSGPGVTCCLGNCVDLAGAVDVERIRHW